MQSGVPTRRLHESVHDRRDVDAHARRWWQRLERRNEPVLLGLLGPDRPADHGDRRRPLLLRRSRAPDRKAIQNSKFGPVLYWWDGWQCLEETDQTTPTPIVVKKYVFGAGSTSRPGHVARLRGREQQQQHDGARDLYFHDNSIGSIVALTKSDGRSSKHTVTTPTVPSRRSRQEERRHVGYEPTKNSLLFHGGSSTTRRQRLYYFRNRYYSLDSAAHSRDPKGCGETTPARKRQSALEQPGQSA